MYILQSPKIKYKTSAANARMEVYLKHTVYNIYKILLLVYTNNILPKNILYIHSTLRLVVNFVLRKENQVSTHYLSAFIHVFVDRLRYKKLFSPVGTIQRQSVYLVTNLTFVTRKLLHLQKTFKLVSFS